MPELLLLAIGLGMAGAVVLAPLWQTRPAAAIADDDREAAELRHRVALEALRDVEADRRAGSLDDASYAAQLAEAETRAAETRAAETHAALEPAIGSPPRPGGSLRRTAMAAAAVIGAVLLAGSLVPPPVGVATRTVTNEALAQTQAAEDARQERIRRLTDAIAAAPDDTESLSDLADAYLAGSSVRDLVAAASALQLLIALEPGRADAYERIVSAYLRAGDAANARAALDSYSEIPTADPVEVAFLDGLVALRGEGDPTAAIEAFERFLDLAPDDPRAGMVRGLKDEAAGAP
jgi:tetratricopeptide (TPR) repeat protein